MRNIEQSTALVAAVLKPAATLHVIYLLIRPNIYESSGRGNGRWVRCAPYRPEVPTNQRNDKAYLLA